MTGANETYIGNMVQGRTRKISYKSKKCRKQNRRDWIVVENTHEPIIEREIFDRVQVLLDSRRRTRSRAYDFPLKGLIYCHECGRPLAVINRKNAAGEDRLYFICRTYQRFTQAGVCTSHTIREQAVTDAVMEKIRQVCRRSLQEERLLPLAQREAAKALAELDNGEKTAGLKGKIDSLTAQLDKVYLDKLGGVLEEADFQRVFTRLKAERAALERRLAQRDRPEDSPAERAGLAKKMAERFLRTASANRELLVSLVERIELTADRQIIIKFRFRQPEANF